MFNIYLLGGWFSCSLPFVVLTLIRVSAHILISNLIPYACCLFGLLLETSHLQSLQFPYAVINFKSVQRCLLQQEKKRSKSIPRLPWHPTQHETNITPSSYSLNIYSSDLQPQSTLACNFSVDSRSNLIIIEYRFRLWCLLLCGHWLLNLVVGVIVLLKPIPWWDNTSLAVSPWFLRSFERLVLLFSSRDDISPFS